MIGYALTLHNSVKRGNAALRNVTGRMYETWRRSSRAIGGYWLGTAEYKGTRDDMLEMFLEGMMREVREDVGGLVTWEGFIAEMQLTLDGVTYIRSMVDVSNAVKEIYTRIGDNMLFNGGAESGAWTVYNGATVTQSTAWVNTGTYSCKIDVADTTIRGAIIDTVTIAAGQSYDVTGVVSAVSGSWRIAANRTDTGASLAHDSTHGATGDKSIKMNIPATNLYAGTVDLIITSEAAVGSIYGDSFSFATSPTQAQTGWALDANSMTEYGRMELAVLDVAMTNAAANAKAATNLKKMAWPKALPPNEFTLVGNELLDTSKDKLALTVHGYVHTLANKYSLRTGTSAASAHVKNIIYLESEFLIPGSINQNMLSYQIDDRAPIKHWQIISDIVHAGDASGNRWVCGVSAGKYFDYHLAENDIAYRYRGGKFYNASGGELEPWFAEPGHLLYLDDLPVGPSQISGVTEDDPHNLFVAEVEMGPPTDAYPQGTLTFRHEVT